MGPRIEHTDIGAYALGLLEPDERRRVEALLAQCPRCRAELPELSRVVAAIRTVPPEVAESVLEPPTDDGPPAPKMRTW